MQEKLTDLLHRGHHSLVVGRGDMVSAFDGRGVSDLYWLIADHSDVLRHAEVADKVVGKGAAALMVLGGVAGLYADLISEPALQLLQAHQVSVAYGKLVPHILNRTGDGICPVEQRCAACTTPEECLAQIAAFIGQTHK